MNPARLAVLGMKLHRDGMDVLGPDLAVTDHPVPAELEARQGKAVDPPWHAPDLPSELH